MASFYYSLLFLFKLSQAAAQDSTERKKKKARKQDSAGSTIYCVAVCLCEKPSQCSTFCVIHIISFALGLNTWCCTIVQFCLWWLQLSVVLFTVVQCGVQLVVGPTLLQNNKLYDWCVLLFNFRWLKHTAVSALDGLAALWLRQLLDGRAYKEDCCWTLWRQWWWLIISV